MTLSRPVPELPVRSVAKAQAHYKACFGFEIGWHNEEGAIGSVFSGDVVIFLRETPADVSAVTCWMFAPDIDAAFKGFQTRGANITNPLQDMPWGLRQFSVQDLDGNIFHIHHDL